MNVFAETPGIFFVSFFHRRLAMFVGLITSDHISKIVRRFHLADIAKPSV